MNTYKYLTRGLALSAALTTATLAVGTWSQAQPAKQRSRSGRKAVARQERRPVVRRTGRAGAAASRVAAPGTAAPRVAAVSWWPIAPLGGKPILSPNLLGPDPIRIQIENPTTQPPANNLALSTSEGAWKGRLAFLPLIYAQPASLPYLVFHGVGSIGVVRGQQASQAFYRLQGPGYFQAPQFSPDGQSLLFRYGDPPADATATSQVYLWDMPNQQITVVGTYDLLTSRYQMSPNSRYIAINYAGPQALTAWERSQSTSPDNWSRVLIRNVGPIGARTAKGYPFRDQWLSHEGARRPMAWTSRNTLLFTMPTGNPVFTSKPFDPRNESYTKVKEANPRPSVAEVAPGGKPAKLIESAYDPVPSPDNRFIAFFGWPGTSATNGEMTPSFYLFERSTKRRFHISDAGAGQIVWSHGGQKLVLLETLESGQAKQYEGRVTQWNLSNILDGVTDTPKPGRLVATLNAQDQGGGTRRGLSAPLFQAKNVSRDSRLLFVSSNPQRGVVGAFPSHEYILQAVDLENGEVATVAKLDDPQGRVIGWDWLDETPTALVP